MKRNLRNLLMVATAIFSICGSAEASNAKVSKAASWLPESPRVAGVNDDVSTQADYTDFTDGIYYIRNAEAGTFFAGGNAWGTRLSLKSAGDLIQITKKSGSDGYIMKDMSLINASTGAQIGEPNGALTIFIDQTSPASGYKFHKLTLDEIKVINNKNSTSFYKNGDDYVDVETSDKAYYLISYVNRNNQTVYLTEGSTAESGHHEVDGKYFDGNIPTLASAVWEIFTRDQLVSDLYNNATEEYFMSATPFITNPDFSRNYNASGNPNDNGWNVVKPISDIFGNNPNFVAKAANIEFELNQTLTNIPNGKYGITANGVYEGEEAATGNPYLYVTVGDKTYKKEFKYSEGSTSIQDWSSKFPSDKSYMLDTIYVTIWNNTLTIGFKGERTDVTSYFDNVQLLYFGKTTNLSTLNTKLNALKKSASTIKKNNKPMSAECKAAIEEVLQLYPDTEDANELNDAIVQLSKAIDDANASIALYGELTEKYLNEVKKLNAEAQEWYDKNITVAIVNAGKLVSEDQLKAGLKTAKIINGKGGDVTEFAIVNPSFETGNTNGWTYDTTGNVDTGIREQSNGTYTMSGADGSYLYNSWNSWAGSPIHQTITGLVAGQYTLTAIMSSTSPSDEPVEGGVGSGKANIVWLKAGTATTYVEAADKTKGNEVKLTFSVLDDSPIEIWAYATWQGDHTNYRWFKVDDFHLIYNGDLDLTELKNELEQNIAQADALLKSKMNSDIEWALRQAKKKAEDTKTSKVPSDYQTAIKNLEEAKSNAQASVNVYGNINQIINAASTNLDKDGQAAFNEYIEKVQVAWSNGTITDGTAELKSAQSAYVDAIKQQTTEETEMTESVGDWKCEGQIIDGQRVIKDWVVLDASKEGTPDITSSVSGNFHINTWSNEGNSDGTPMTTPFTEFWSSSADGYLRKNHIIIKHNTETGYRPGRYTLSIIARLYDEGGNYMIDESAPQGYKFSANGIESQTSYTFNNTGKNKLFWANDEVDFFIDEDGKLDFQFEINNSNFNWLAFKMIKLIYHGNNYNDEDAKKIIDAANANFGQPMDEQVESKLENAINNFRNTHSVPDGKAVQLAVQEAKTSIQTYEYIIEQLDLYNEKAKAYNDGAGFDDLGKKAFNDAWNKALDAYNNGTLTEADKEIAATIYKNGLLSQAEGDFTDLIVNPSFETGNSTGWTIDGSNSETKIVNIANEGRYAMDPMDGNFLYNTWDPAAGGYPIHQSISGLPAGSYTLSAWMTSTNNGSDVRTVHLNAGNYTAGAEGKGDGVGQLVELNFEVSTASAIEITAWASNSADATLDGTDKSWFKVDNFQLYYNGPSDIDNLLDILADACDYADQYITKAMNKDVYKPLKETYDKSKEVIEKKNATSDEIIKLKDDLLAYSNASKSSIEVYKEVYEYYEIAMTLDTAGQNTFRRLAKDVIADYQAGNITDGISERSHLEGWLRTATKSQIKSGSNWTGAILNESFEEGMQDWKTQSGYKSFKALETNPKWEGTHKKLYAFRDNTGTSKMKCNFYQDIDTVKIGVYKMKAKVYTNSSSMYIYGNDLKAKLTPSTTLTETYKEVEQIVVSWDGKRLTLGFIGDLQPGEYIRVDSMALTYVSKDLDINNEKVPDSVKYNNDLKKAQNAAVAAFRKEPQPEKLSPALEAIRLAKESAQYYATAKLYLDSAIHYMEHSNVYTQKAYNQCMKLWNELSTGYENCTLTNDDCKSMFYKFFQNGFVGFNDQTATDEDTYENYPILNYIFDAWTLTDDMGETVKADGSFKVNNWSKLEETAATKDTQSEMTTPYIEYWKYGSPLNDATIHAKAINLQGGWLYKMKVLVRVANETETVAPEDFDGITLNVTTDRVKENNGIALFESDTINVCKGDVHIDKITNDKNVHNVVSQVFEIDSIIVRAKDNHDANVYFNIENTNVNWLNWKFCQFIPVRELYFNEENDLASDAEIKELEKLIARDEKKPIGFNMNEFSTYANRDIIKAHNAAKKYLKTNGAIDPVINSHHLTKFQVNEYINALKDESQWIIQKGDTNCFYNPYFSLVKDNNYTKLFGWDIVDNYIEDPIIGGMGATSATADPTWTKFVNNRKARNLNGEWNTFSTAATFRFEENNGFCSSNSVYNYGNETGFEMPLQPDQAYTLTFQYGFRTETQPGSVIIEVINKRTGEIVNRSEDRLWTPLICVSDTDKIPETKQIIFNTSKRDGYSNSLSNFDNFETYKVVVRNADPSNLWTMVISNIKLYRYPNALMKIAPGAHWGTFIASFETTVPDGITAYVVTGKDSQSHTYKNETTGEEIGTYTSLHLGRYAKQLDYWKNGRKGTYLYDLHASRTIPPHVPVVIYTDNNDGYEGMVAGKNELGERTDSVRYYKETSKDIYLEGYEGRLTVERPDSLAPLTAKDGWYILQLHKNELSACFYLVDQSKTETKTSPLIPANRCYLVDPLAATTGNARLRKLVFSLDDARDIATSIENSDNQNDDVEIIGIYSVNGVLQDELKEGVNIVRLSNGMTKKIIK